ncbi:MAG: chaperone modulator CbpM [Steroidobacteraceae bacterium]
MPTDNIDGVWLDARYTLTLVELADQSGLSVAEVTELVECGVLAPAATSNQAERFPATSLTIARKAARLRTDFELPASGLALAVRLLDRISELEAQLKDLHARLPRYHG